MTEPERASPDTQDTPRGPKMLRNTVSARNVEGVRTVVSTRGGLSLATDEPVSRGGRGSAPTPLETVVGALCGCSAVTFERAAGEVSFDYAGIDFDAAYTLDRRGLLGEADVRPHFQTVEVEARVRTAEPLQALPPRLRHCGACLCCRSALVLLPHVHARHPQRWPDFGFVRNSTAAVQ